jgi:hypothetical protein
MSTALGRDEVSFPWISNGGGYASLEPPCAVTAAPHDKENVPPAPVNITAICTKGAEAMTYPLRFSGPVKVSDIKEQVEFGSARTLLRDELCVMPREDGAALPDDAVLDLSEGQVVLLRPRAHGLVNISVFVGRGHDRPCETIYEVVVREELSGAELRRQIELETGGELKPISILLDEDHELGDDEIVRLDDAQMIIARCAAADNVVPLSSRTSCSATVPAVKSGILSRWFQKSKSDSQAQDFQVGGIYQIRSRSTMRQEEGLNTPIITELMPPSTVEILQFGADPRRARVKVNNIEGWISLWSKPSGPWPIVRLVGDVSDGPFILWAAGLKTTGDILTCSQEPAMAIFEVPDHSFFELAALPVARSNTQWMFGMVPAASFDGDASSNREKKPSLRSPAERKSFMESGFFFCPNGKNMDKYSTSRQTLDLGPGEVLSVRWAGGALHAQPGDQEPIKFQAPIKGINHCCFRPCLVLLEKNAAVRLIS